MNEEELRKYYNEVSTLTAVCRTKSSWLKGESPELVIGKTYHVSHISVQKSASYILLSEFGLNHVYNTMCFDIYENGVSIGNLYTQDLRFLAPYLRNRFMDENPHFIDEHTAKYEIPRHLHHIEREYNVKILLAVESGSRAWGTESKNSDWDVRFIYVHKPEWYLKIEDQRDIIEHVYNDRLDMIGWDLKKALSLLYKSNPSMLEWLNSPIVYKIDEYFGKRIHDVADDYCNPIGLMYHYNHIYNKHNERFIQKKGYPVKCFLYYLHGLLSCKWIEQNISLPPIPFKELSDATVEDKAIRSKIDELIQIKRGDKECDMTVVDEALVEYARHWGEYYNEKIDSFRPEKNDASTEALDSILFDMVILHSDFTKDSKSLIPQLLKSAKGEDNSLTTDRE